jgi:RNA polymerase sigma-70 factor (ECF subfamily)
MSELPAAVPGPLPAPEDILLRTFNELRDRLVERLRGLLGNDADAQDVAQVTFLHCWQARDRLAGVARLHSWIWRAGLNAARDLHRSAWHRRFKLQETLSADLRDPAQPGASDRLVACEELERCRAALVRLRPQEREVFLLRQNHELSYKEIAERSGRPLGTVKAQMQSALRKLRAALYDADGA